MSRKRNDKIIKNPRSGNLNVGVVIFIFIFIYLVICFGVYLSKETVRIYEVTKGTLTSYADYQALILRNEEVETSSTAGYINYYIRNGRKVGKGNLVYSIDEVGRTQNTSVSDKGDNKLSNKELLEFKGEVMDFVQNFHPMEFEAVYEVKSNLEASVLEYINASTLEELAGQQGTGTSGIVKAYASKSGIFSTVIDGLEGYTPADVTASCFNASDFPRKFLTNGTAVGQDTGVYRRVLNEEWYLIFQISEKDQERFAGQNKLTLKFRGTDLEATGNYECFLGADGEKYGKITLDRYMIRFIDKRYVNIEIATSEQQGLKIPVSALVKKDYFKVPKNFLTEDGKVLLETYDINGEVTVKKLDTISLSWDSDYCYVDKNLAETGQFLRREDESDRYQLVLMASLDGVYNVNKGYTIFRKVEIIDTSEEYYIISIPYSGISRYDHIVLNGDSVTEGQIIYY